MPMSAVCLCNAVLPGSGLLLRGRTVSGLVLLVLALVVVVAAGLAAVLGSDAFAARIALLAIIAYLSGALASTGLWWLWERDPGFDRAQVLALCREATVAHLHGRTAEALAAARRLARRAPALDGSWRLLALMAEAAGDAALARRAGIRLARLELRAVEERLARRGG